MDQSRDLDASLNQIYLRDLAARKVVPNMSEKLSSTKSSNPWSNYLCFEKKESTAIVPTKSTENSAGYDIYAFEKAIIMPGTIVKMRTGIHAKLPVGYYGQLFSRSGLACKGIIVLAGVIDNDYTGEIIVLLHNIGETPYQVTEQDRIAQMVLIKNDTFVTKEVTNINDLFGETERGDKGFGSSGK